MENVKAHDFEYEASLVLRSERCACGRHKQSQKSFCTLCYNLLPAPLRAKLFATFKEGYAQFYQEAVQFLRKNTTRMKKVSA